MTTVPAVYSHAAAPALPPGPGLPAPLLGIGFIAALRRTTDWLTRTCGPAVTLRLPVYGDTVLVSDSALVKQVFSSSPEVLHNIDPNLSRFLGEGSVFGLEGEAHRRRRRLLTPPFHGKSIAAYERIVEEETMREMVSWPEGIEFPTFEPMMRITLNVILRAVFGAEGEELQQLREKLPRWIALGSRLVALPTPTFGSRKWGPWARMDEYRQTYEALIDRLIVRARQDPSFEDRTDVLSLFLRSTYDDGTTMTRQEIGDELLTLLVAGHETTGSTLSWAFERISRHPQVLERLVAEVGGEGRKYRQATIFEVQRNRTVIDFAARNVAAPMYELGEWTLPQGFSILICLLQLHRDPKLYPDPDRFDPERFLNDKPSSNSWVPFGGGTRRCVGAAFANMEMDVVLRTVLRHFIIGTTAAAAEKPHHRGVAVSPKRGGRVTVYRRAVPLGAQSPCGLE